MNARPAAVLLAAALTACERTAAPAPTDRRPATAPRTAAAREPAAPPSPAPAALEILPAFRDVADEAGFVAVNHTGMPDQKDWIVSAMGGGVIALDYDSDGDIDVVVVDGTMLTPAGVLEFDDAWRTRLFRNDGAAGAPMRFIDVTATSGIDLEAFGIGGAACDYDADGHPDFFVACWGPSHLFRNRGDGTFEDVTAKAGVAGDARDMSTACAWGDVDGDGVHDLYVATHVDQRAYIEEQNAAGKGPRITDTRGFQVAGGPLGLVAQRDRLYLGRGDGTFREVTDANLADQKARHGFQPVMTDVDNDGDLDIFVANDLDPNHLWVNDGRGVFRDRAVLAGCGAKTGMVEQAGMGADAGDVNRDGWIDLALTAFSSDQNTVFVNRTGRTHVLTFSDQSQALGVAAPSFHRTSWGVQFADYDNDGWLDHVSACGHIYGEIEGFSASIQSPYRQRCQILHNAGPPTWKFVETTGRAGPAFEIERVWRGAAFGDFDDDGDTDIYVAALNDRAAILRNDGGNRNAFLRFRLTGKAGLRDPSGARVVLTMPDGRKHMSELHHGAAFLSDNDPRLTFGCGQLATISKVEIFWPGVKEPQTFTDVPTRKAYLVEQGKDELRPDPSLR